jgi:uncharacterized protein YunC (DUF1805 family)
VAAVEGAIKAASDVGVDSAEAVKAAITGAIRAADEIGTEAGSAVRDALLSAASLPRDIIESTIKGSQKD